MKPLPVAKTLPSVEPTLEDRDIWWWHVERRGREFSATKAIFCVYADADRRDAANMLWWGRMPAFRPTSWLPWAISCDFQEVLPL